MHAGPLMHAINLHRLIAWTSLETDQSISTEGRSIPEPRGQSPMPPDILTTVLPNGLSVQHVSASDVAFLYEETFQSNAYLQHGVQLRPGGTVLDVGEQPELCRWCGS